MSMTDTALTQNLCVFTKREKYIGEHLEFCNNRRMKKHMKIKHVKVNQKKMLTG